MYKIIMYNYQDDETMSFTSYAKVQFMRFKNLVTCCMAIDFLSKQFPKIVFEPFEIEGDYNEEV